jgi:hypothetical protein
MSTRISFVHRLAFLREMGKLRPESGQRLRVQSAAAAVPHLAETTARRAVPAAAQPAASQATTVPATEPESSTRASGILSQLWLSLVSAAVPHS